jgi:hypothetical protein
MTEPSNTSKWTPANHAQLAVGDLVRVLPNAFRYRAGDIHNGRFGLVVSISDGDVVMKSIDNKLPILSAAHYPIYKLEKNAG